ncbi:MAG TPA: oligopeptide ABC transporter substrate-binding protein [Pseudogracilibacillus sp.]|nr:oligopeptide ABC transporter substrate-binding protein [Pseudogracilibacillus sp.]
MSRKLLLFLAIIFSLSLVLAACGGGNDNTAGNNGNNSGNANADEGGTMTYAIKEEPEGLLVDGFAGSAIDAEILDYISDDLITVNDDMEYESAIADWETEDNQVFDFTIEEGVQWHNGEELTMEDWQFAIEVLADPDYDGPRFDYVAEIEGAEEYRDGDADEISGFEIEDDYNATITFKEAKVNNLENLWSTPMPKAELEDIPVEDMDASEEVRETPVGLGPFKVKEIQQGEYYSLERFDDYWQGTPKLDEVLIKVIDSSAIIGSLESGEVDFMEITPDDVDDLEANDGIDVIEQEGLGYSYIGFRFGHYDADEGTAVADYDKFDSKELRQALFYALDRESIVDNYLNGTATIVNTPVPSVHWISADEDELTQYDYDPDKAEEMLDEAGYEKGEDGMRTDPDGNEFVVKFGHFAGDSAFEGRAQAIIQNWEDVGIQTELATGELVEFNTFNEMKDNDDEELETFFGAWSVGSDPDPSGLWRSTAEWNYGRWVNEESDELLDDGLSEDAFDDDYRKDVYVEWQQLFNEELPGLPLWENMDLYGKNERLQDVVVGPNGPRDFHEWSITD